MRLARLLPMSVLSMPTLLERGPLHTLSSLLSAHQHVRAAVEPLRTGQYRHSRSCRPCAPSKQSKPLRQLQPASSQQHRASLRLHLQLWLRRRMPSQQNQRHLHLLRCSGEPDLCCVLAGAGVQQSWCTACMPCSRKGQGVVS